MFTPGVKFETLTCDLGTKLILGDRDQSSTLEKEEKLLFGQKEADAVELSCTKGMPDPLNEAVML